MKLKSASPPTQRNFVPGHCPEDFLGSGDSTLPLFSVKKELESRLCSQFCEFSTLCGSHSIWEHKQVHMPVLPASIFIDIVCLFQQNQVERNLELVCKTQHLSLRPREISVCFWPCHILSATHRSCDLLQWRRGSRIIDPTHQNLLSFHAELKTDAYILFLFEYSQSLGSLSFKVVRFGLAEQLFYWGKFKDTAHLFKKKKERKR